MNMNAKLIKSAFVGALLALMSSVAPAAILEVSGGILVGAKHVDVGGTFFNVSFQKGTCISLYNGCTDDAMALSSQAQANAAAQALLDQVFIDGLAGQFDSDTTKTFGCSSTANCLTRIVYKHNDPANSPQAVVANLAAQGVDFVFNETLPATANTNFSNVNFATFTAEVPLPGTLSLIGLGLVGLFGARRRRAA